MPKNTTVALARIGIASAMTLALFALHLAFPRVAFAHHIEIAPTHTCGTYSISADYIGGSSGRYAVVSVNGVPAGTFDFPGSGPDFVDDFYVLTGALPANVTVEVRLYIPQPGPDQLESTTSATVDEDLTCTPTATPSATGTHTPAPSATPAPSNTPAPSSTATPSDTSTATAVASSTATPADTATPVPTTSATPPAETPDASTQTPVATTSSTPVIETPTFVSTVESLLPPEGPGTGGTPPEETASGLPNAGSGSVGSGIAVGLAFIALAAGGLALTTIALRRDTNAS